MSVIRWGLVGAMEHAGMRRASQLHRALAAIGFDTSASSVQRLVAGEVSSPSLELLAALCDVTHSEIGRMLIREIPPDVSGAESQWVSIPTLTEQQRLLKPSQRDLPPKLHLR